MGSSILKLFLVVQKSEVFALLIGNPNYQFLKPLEWSQKSKFRTVISIFKFFDALQKYQNFLQNLFDLPFDSFLQFPCMGQLRFNLTSPTLFQKHSKCRIWISAFSTNFCPLKSDLSGNTVWLQASGFQKLAKMDHFWHFYLPFVHSKCKRCLLQS